MLKKIVNWLLLLLLFLLPWQTRWIYDPATLNGDYWEYGTASFYGTEILLWMIVILFSIYYFRRRDFWARLTSRVRFQKQRWSLLLGLAVLMAFMLSLGKSVAPEISYNHFLWILGGLCVGVVMIISWDNSARDFRRGLVAFWLGAVVQGGFAIWQFAVQYSPANKWFGLASHFPWQAGASVIEVGGERWLRAYGSLGGPNPLGIYLAVALMIGLVLYLITKEWKYRIPLAVGQIFILTGLFFTFSRGAWLAAGVGIMAMILVGAKTNRGALRDLGRQIFYYLIAGVVFVGLFWPMLSVRIDATARLEKKSLSERQEQISTAVDIIAAHPWLGVGEGAYTYELYRRQPHLSGGNYQPVHNIYLLALAELGIFGSALFLVLGMWLFRKIMGNNIWFAPVILTLVVAGMFDHWAWSIAPGVMFWWIIWAFGMVRTGKMWANGGQTVDDKN
ncbi:MAG: hypothetical protein A2261_02905 [Candidatus Magasanikbacteria bacterium RIFOXYA2_FULL_44_8]|uniref:O-antigen ligase-related domain-containing protein n=1 Tax=Candidatus Magasanikbacteria bacterium RIFOXYA2_FULL_44_8 TaxID=1798696 RepID=A0A1F6NJL8_9BACT|nr:MAG: hypothetical protein A2261_02905 [Candidatus Magasanikbacteria bacterium RIFOXYA2_FULL_44_8]